MIMVVGNDFNDEGEFVSPGGTADFMAPVIQGLKNMGKPLQAAVLKLAAKSKMKGFHAVDGSAVGGDRQSLSLKPDQARMIEEVGPLNPNTVVALVTGSMIMLDAWADRVPAVLYAWYAGMEGGTALARVLFGDVNPSGKLPFTIPSDVSHLPYFSSTDKEITYDLYHGYTLLDKKSIDPKVPFGFGLSYTSFVYDNLFIYHDRKNVAVKVSVTNSGARDGEEVVQAYVGKVDSTIDRQKKLLKGFKKVFIRAGETVDVTITIPIADLRYYSLSEKSWVLEPGTYEALVGPSSAEETLLKTNVEL